MDTKELRELLRAVSLIILEVIEDVKDDGKLSAWEGIEALHLIPAVIKGIRGFNTIPDELRDIQPDEWNQIVSDIKRSFLASGQTHRRADILERVMKLAYLNVVEISEMSKLPVSAQLVVEGT